MGYFLKLFANTTFRGSVLFFLGGIAANAFNYIYRVAMGRMLDPAEFGEIIALVSLFLIFAVPASPLQTVGAKVSAQLASSLQLGGVRAFFFRATFLLGVAALLVMALGVLLAPFLIEFLHISSPFALFWAWGAVAFLLISSISRGVLQGLERFSHTAVLVSVEGAVKMGAAVLFVGMGWGVAGAAGGLFVSALSAYILSLIFLRDIFIRQNGGEGTIKDGHLAREIFLAFLVFFFLNVLLNVDVVLVKHYFSPEDAGVYSALATLGRIVFLMGTILAGVFFPLVVRSQASGKNVFRPFMYVGGISVGIAVFNAIIFALFPQFFLQLFFGEAYLAGVPYVGYYSILMVLMAAVFLSSYFFMALGRFSFLWILFAGSIAEIIMIQAWHADSMQVLGAITLSLTGTLVGMAFFLLRNYRSRMQETGISVQ
jgi:O-antigen/teichoic acid export membrane protein